MYRASELVPLVEQSPVGAANSCGKEQVVDILSDLVSADPDWSVAVLRYFHPVGAHESGRIGEDPGAFLATCFRLWRK